MHTERRIELEPCPGCELKAAINDVLCWAAYGDNRHNRRGADFAARMTKGLSQKFTKMS